LLVSKLLEFDKLAICFSLLLRTFKIVANAGKIAKHINKYKEKKPKKTQNNCEKNEKISNCGIIYTEKNF